MTSNRPYLIRALYEWLMDNDQTPHLLVDASGEGVVVPQQFVKDGRIVLNIGPSAVRGLDIGNESIVFGARFGGMSMEVFVPPSAVLGIYAKENGRGMLFPHDETEGEGTDEEPEPPVPGGGGGRPKLTIVK